MTMMYALPETIKFKKFALKTELAKQNIFFWVLISQILEDEEGRACQCEEAVRGQEGREAPENRRCAVMTRSLVCEGQSERGLAGTDPPGPSIRHPALSHTPGLYFPPPIPAQVGSDSKRLF